MLLTAPQYNCTKAIVNTKVGVYIDDPRFLFQTVASLLTRKLLDISMEKKNEGRLIATEFTKPVYRLNQSIHAARMNYEQAQKKVRSAKKMVPSKEK